MFSVRFESGIEDRLADVARRTGKSKSECVLEAVVAYLEDFDDRRIALDRLRNPARQWDLADLEADFDTSG